MIGDHPTRRIVGSVSGRALRIDGSGRIRPAGATKDGGRMEAPRKSRWLRRRSRASSERIAALEAEVAAWKRLADAEAAYRVFGTRGALKDKDHYWRRLGEAQADAVRASFAVPPR